MINLLCIDPGKTLGVVYLTVPKNKPARIDQAFEIPGTARSAGDLVKGNLDRIIMEDWTYQHNQPVDAKDACLPMGGVLYVADLVGVPVTLQSHLFRLSIPDDELSTPPDWWLPDLKDHDDRRQALRQGLAYVCFTLNHLPSLEHLRPRPPKGGYQGPMSRSR